MRLEAGRLNEENPSASSLKSQASSLLKQAMLQEGVILINSSYPAAWPTRAHCDSYPFDLDASQRFTRFAQYLNRYPQVLVNVVSPQRLIRGVEPIQPLIENLAYAKAYIKGNLQRGPWVEDVRAGGIPWISSFPFERLQPKVLAGDYL